MRFEGFHIAPGVLIDIDRARRMVGDRKPDSRIYLPRHAIGAREGWFHIDRRHMRRKGKSGPALLIQIGKMRVVVDGNHRALRAHRRGAKWYPAILLTPEEVRACSRDYSKVPPRR